MSGRPGTMTDTQWFWKPAEVVQVTLASNEHPGHTNRMRDLMRKYRECRKCQRAGNVAEVNCNDPKTCPEWGR